MLEWMGKAKVINHHNEVPFHVLERKYSFDGDGQHSEDNGSENMIIHGDNLLALKSLLPRYEGKVKCIYIDPPYNTGNEGWCYNDNVNDPQIKAWLGKVVGKEGEDFSRHDKWLCMMYPRLKLLQKLLSPDGAIFISIDDNEQANLKLVCDEIFGSQNFITSFIWRKVDSPNDNKVSVTPDHEYVLAYAKDGKAINLRAMEAPDIVEAYGQCDANGRRYRDRLLKKNGKNSLRSDRPTMYFPLTAPDGSEVFPVHDNGQEARWAMGCAGIAQKESEGLLIWKKRTTNGVEHWVPYTREFAPENPTRPYPSIWSDLDTMRQAKAMLREIYGNINSFDTPKPVGLVERIIRMTCDKDSIVLDSFAGSGTTAHAVLNANKQDGGNRKFILVEMMDYADSVTAERVKRVIKGYGSGEKAVEGTGGSFGYYELGPELMKDGVLNEDVGEAAIREYVWYTETKGAGKYEVEKVGGGGQRKDTYLLGSAFGVAYYFCYEKGAVVTLNRALLKKIKTKAESYVVYADACTLSEDELERYHIVFKKIPRDVARF